MQRRGLRGFRGDFQQAAKRLALLLRRLDSLRGAAVSDVGPEVPVFRRAAHRCDRLAADDLNSDVRAAARGDELLDNRTAVRQLAELGEELGAAVHEGHPGAERADAGLHDHRVAARYAR